MFNIQKIKTQNYIIVLVLLTIISSCTASKSTATASQIKILDSIVAKPHFRIESNRAHPMVTNAMQQVLNSGLMQPGNSAAAISLIGNTNFLTISGDSISSYLPYFGERQMQVAYGGGDSAIQFDGILEDYDIEKQTNNSYRITFQAKSKSENFNGSITIFPNLKTNMVLNGNSRFSISYSGEIIRQTK